MPKHTAKPYTVTSYEVAPNLYLVRQPVALSTPAPPAKANVNHLAVIDCSGSMSGDLPQIREQLKTRLPKLLADGDTFSLIWFSGRGQFGALLEAEPVATLNDLNEVNKAIDRWLRPVGMTGFVEPLTEVQALVARVSKKNKNPFSLFFMSDGCDNQWDRSAVLAAVQNAAPKLASATFVEYGYYADRPLLAAMAAKAGGQLIFAEDFGKYRPVFEAKMATHELGGKRITVKIDGNPIGGFVYALDAKDQEITTFEMNAGGVTAPEGAPELWYLSPTEIGHKSPMPISEQARGLGRKLHDFVVGSLSPAIPAVYAALSLFAVRMKPEIVFPLLKALGDVSFIKRFSQCFGKQRYSDFMTWTKVAAFQPSHRFVEGYDPNLVPPDDAFTVLDLLRVLTSCDKTRLLLDDPSFRYSRVSRKRLDANEVMTDDESEQIETIRAKMAGEKSAKKLKELQAEIDAILKAKQEALTFVPDAAPDGYPINGIVYNETRPNVSMRVLKTGTVDLSSRTRPRPKSQGDVWIPEKLKTHIFRNYTLIRDGLVNIEILPAVVTQATYMELKKNGVNVRLVVGKGDDHYQVMIDVAPLPVISRQMVKSVSADEMLRMEYRLTRARAEQKVFNHYAAEKFPEAKQASLIEKYGEDGAAWLKEQGITSNGWAPPHTVQAESTDVYFGKELDIKIKGFSKLPSVASVIADIKAGKKPATAAKMLATFIHEVEDFLHHNPASTHQKWILGRKDAATATVRGMIYRMAEMRFSIIVGQTWPHEFKSLDDNKLTIKIEGEDVTGTFELSDIEIKI